MKKNIKITLVVVTFVFTCLLSIQTVKAQDWQPIGATNDREINVSEVLKSYRDLSKVPSISILVPTIVEVDFDSNQVYADSFLVYNDTTKQFIPSQLMYADTFKPRVTRSVDTVSLNDQSQLFDNNYGTMSDFYLNKVDTGSAIISVDFQNPIKSNSLTLSLDNYVSLPSSITIKATISDREVTILNKYTPKSTIVTFPEATSNKWIVELAYAQPLRVSEIIFNNNFNVVSKKSIRFLALPNNSYTIYVNPEILKRNDLYTSESPNFNTNDGVKKLGLLNISTNPTFVLSDIDDDKIPDIKDNCVNVSNPLQEDININGRGDLCDDFDSDGVINSKDNCPDVVNRNQKDTDGDGLGDSCDYAESRLTEKYPFIVWFGIGFASLVFLGLLYIVGNKIRKDNKNDVPPPTQNLDNNN
jgi:Thrombospondin type 3 repeat